MTLLKLLSTPLTVASRLRPGGPDRELAELARELSELDRPLRSALPATRQAGRADGSDR